MGKKTYRVEVTWDEGRETSWLYWARDKWRLTDRLDQAATFDTKKAADSAAKAACLGASCIFKVSVEVPPI